MTGDPGGDAGAVTVRDVPERRRYEAVDDAGTVLGVLVYRPREDAVALVHTIVEPAAEGRGVGRALARTALDDLRSRGARVDVVCPFVRAWIGRHPEYADSL